MKELEKQLNEMLKRLGSDSNKIDMIQEEESRAPFGMVNRLMAYLLAAGELSF